MQINKNLVITLSILIVVTLILISLIIGVYYFKVHEKLPIVKRIFNKKNITENIYAKSGGFIQDNTDDNTNNNSEEEINKYTDPDATSDSIDDNNETTIVKQNEKDPEQQEMFKESKIKQSNFTKTNSENNKNTDINYNDKNRYSKGSNIPEQNFHSLGEYVSNEEKQNRLNLINSLSIKTIVIDKLSQGNGISQEFYKVAYINEMIPAKILQILVESKEFRDLIPEYYLRKEILITGLKNSESVTFKKESIKNLLILWSNGKLTPVQKAWTVKAEK